MGQQDADDYVIQNHIVEPMVTEGCNILVSQVEKKFGTPLVLGTSVLGKATLGETAALTAAKGFAKGATSNWLIVGDVVQLGTGAIVSYAGGGKVMSEVVSSVSGLATNVGIGFATGGPLGAGGGAAVWIVGKVVSITFSLFRK